MNLFMHYAFDTWMQRTSPNCPFARYADDAVVHCRSRKQAEYVMRSIASRLAACGLTMHPEKSKVVYCKDSNRRAGYPHVSFTFLGFTFRPRKALSKQDQLFTSFLPSECGCLKADAASGTQVATQSPNPRDAGRRGSALQSSDTGVVAILWLVLSDSHAWHLPAH